MKILSRGVVLVTGDSGFGGVAIVVGLLLVIVVVATIQITSDLRRFR